MADKYSTTRYNQAPVLTHGRTRFDLSHSVLTTFNTGDLVPILAEPIFPGDTVSLNTAMLTRLETALHQTMDNAYLEFSFFFVPNRIIWDNFDKFMGANDDPWTQTTDYKIPQIILDKGTNGAGAPAHIDAGSLWNHLALPVGSYGSNGAPSSPSIDERMHVSQLPLRAVFQCFNDWYRDENFDSIVYFDKGDNHQYLNKGFTYNGATFYPERDVLKVNRFKDLFSTALPAPQKGQDTFVNIFSGVLAPVITSNSLIPVDPNENGLIFRNRGVSALSGSHNLSTDAYSALQTDGSSIGSTDSQVVPANLYADLSNQAIVTINQLRLAITRQAMKERDARAGTRMNETIASIFGIKVNDLEIGRSEFLGGKRIPVNMMEVLQTSETGTTVLGTDAGHSKTVDYSPSFVKSFTQYGWIIGFMYARTSRSYSQGIDRKFFEYSKFDMLDPMLDNIGEIPIYKKEIYALDGGVTANIPYLEQPFGYQEQYYWLKERTNRYSGFFQAGITGTLDSWHYGDKYTSIPSLSSSWLKESPDQVDRTIAVSSNASFQWSANVAFELYITRTLKKYSIPNTFGF